ncbi:hypothetical protein CVIRNUC_010081 [Coccomyxa viridis]|uniref:Uncharacterized protein n=1 Tax=Coccomyxa viridis TaxID=1274662 RepID=A0AAV1IKZ5_9CHLO|nr:hypothetical protein CVIRNUC_010081 [Coccomyxa viridis]
MKDFSGSAAPAHNDSQAPKTRPDVDLGKEKRSCTVSWPCIKAFLIKNFLPLGFLVSIIWMIVWPWPGERVESWRVKNYSIVETLCIIIIFVISGLVLKTEELLAAIKHPFPLLYGLVAILGMTPMIGFATIHIPFQPPEFAVGLTVFAIGPSTLAQGQTLVRQAGGNTTLALMLLVLSNTLAVFIAPFLIKAMLASRSDGIHLDSAGLLINLVVTVLAPSIVGKVIRELIPPVGKWVSSNRVTMGLLNNGTLIIIVWIQLCSAHRKIFQQPFQDIVLIIIGAVLLHFVFVAINWPLVALMRFPPKEAIAVLIMSSQKTMPFAVSIIALLPASLGSKGLLTLPPLVAQVSQLFCDIWIARYFAHKIDAQTEAEEAASKLPTTTAHVPSNGLHEGGKHAAAAQNGACEGSAGAAINAAEGGAGADAASNGHASAAPGQSRNNDILDSNAQPQGPSLSKRSLFRDSLMGHDPAYAADCGSIEETPSSPCIQRSSSAMSDSVRSRSGSFRRQSGRL